ncbi:hypothetical protein BH23PLA1_BH23PLA1_24510 [soil metagenome]
MVSNLRNRLDRIDAALPDGSGSSFPLRSLPGRRFRGMTTADGLIEVVQAIGRAGMTRPVPSPEDVILGEIAGAYMEGSVNSGFGAWSPEGEAAGLEAARRRDREIARDGGPTHDP